MWLLKNLLLFVLTYICLTGAQVTSSDNDDESNNEIMDLIENDTTNSTTTRYINEDEVEVELLRLITDDITEPITNKIRIILNDFPSLDNETRESIFNAIRLILQDELMGQTQCTTPSPPSTTRTTSTTTPTTISTTTSTTITTTPRPPPHKATDRPRSDCGSKKKCVLFWECEESYPTINRWENYEFDLNKMKSCKHYLETCCPEGKIINKKKAPCPLAKQSFECGYANSNGVCMSVYNKTNSEADFGEFPWAVTIRVNKDFIGGSLISDRLVLTVRSQIPRNVELWVRAGEWDRMSVKGDAIIPYQETLVKEIISHPEFDMSTILFDVVLLVLDKPFELMPHIRPICLSNTENLDYTKCIVTGWNNNPLLNRWTPRAVNVTFDCDNEENIDTKRCAKISQNSFKYSLGSALVCPTSDDYNRYYQVGIWSYFVKETEIMFSDLSVVHDWITNKTNSIIN